MTTAAAAAVSCARTAVSRVAVTGSSSSSPAAAASRFTRSTHISASSSSVSSAAIASRRARRGCATTTTTAATSTATIATYPRIAVTHYSTFSASVLRPSPLVWGRMPPKAKVKKASGDDKKVEPQTTSNLLEVTCIHVIKAQKAPTLQPDAKYPEWIFDASLAQLPSLNELTLRKQTGEELSPELERRYVKLERRRLIKERNEETRKK